MNKIKNILIGIFAISSITLFFLMDNYKHKSKENYDSYIRWRENYITSNKEFIKEKLKNGNEIYKLGQVILTKNELLYSKDLKLEALRDKVKENDLELKELKSSLLIELEIKKELQGIIDSSYVELINSDTELDLQFVKDSIYATVKVKTDLQIYESNTKKLYKQPELRNSFGRWFVNTKLGYALAKKTIVTEISATSSNKNLIINNITMFKINDTK